MNVHGPALKLHRKLNQWNILSDMRFMDATGLNVHCPRRFKRTLLYRGAKTFVRYLVVSIYLSMVFSVISTVVVFVRVELQWTEQVGRTLCLWLGLLTLDIVPDNLTLRAKSLGGYMCGAGSSTIPSCMWGLPERECRTPVWWRLIHTNVSFLQFWYAFWNSLIFHSMFLSRKYSIMFW